MRDNHLTRLWTSLHEPRGVTAVMVSAYIACIVFGFAVLVLTLQRPADDLRDATLIAVGVLCVLTGSVGAPTAWTGRQYLESAVALGLPLIGLLTLADAALIVASGGSNLPRIVVMSCLGALMMSGFGISRHLRLRASGPYALGHGPQLPEHRIAAAEVAMATQDNTSQEVLTRRVPATGKGD